MMKIDKKYTFQSMAVLMMTVLVLASCMGSDDIVTTPECAITGFTVNNITCDVKTKKYDQNGNAIDTLVSRTMYGSQIFFNIDQLNGYIHTVDSLPNWVDLTKVVPTVYSQGNVYYKLEEDDELYYPLVSGSTIIDFNKTVEMLCESTDGLSKRIYKVDIYKHVGNTDTLEWKSTTSNLTIVGPNKAFYVDGKVFVFAQNDSHNSVVTFAEADDAAIWSTPVTIPVDDGSIVLFGNDFYGLGSDGYIYRSTLEEQAATWAKASDLHVERLLAADAYYLYAYNGTSIISTSDLNTWTEEESNDLEMLPETSLNSLTYPSSTNKNLQIVVMTGLSSQNIKNGVTWYKTSTLDTSTNQSWAYVKVTPDNAYGIPHFEFPSVTYYNGALYAIGVEEDAYTKLYRSDDNGITWHQQEKYPVPEDLKPVNGVASIVAVNQKIWIIQENGKVWQGSIQ
ncbi:MAG: hypothetical protein J6T38_00770 [Bacteroidaceae bacterium]|nr:hypothetical protein [Bacteroidaceae bacterium]